MSTSARVASMLAVVALLTRCSSATEVESAHSKWNALRPASYVYTVQRLCECPTDVTRPVVVSVVSGVVQSRRYEDTGADVATQFSELFPTIDGLFSLIEDARAKQAATVDATYDAMFGFPSRLYIDYVAAAADDEVTFVTRGFTAK